MADIVAFRDPNRRPGYYRLDQIYDPDLTDQVPPLYIPEPQSLVIDSQGSLFRVVTLDDDTFKAELVPALVVLTDDTRDTQVSIEDYTNSTFVLYVDDRNRPTRLALDSRLVVYGITEHYELIRNYDTDDAETISIHYGTDGGFISTQVPMLDVLDKDGEPTNVRYPRVCHTTTVLEDGDPLTMVVSNAQDAVVATVTVFVKHSAIQAATTGNEPVITDMSITGNQSRGNDEFFVTQGQDISELNLQGRLTYDDGTTEDVDVDRQKLYLYGADEFFPSWTGLRQPIMMKYYLSPGQTSLGGAGAFLTAEADLIVVSAESRANVKMILVPSWSSAASAYVLRYYLYSTDRDRALDITDHVTFRTGEFLGAAFGDQQVLELQVDLNAVDSTTWPETLLHSQDITIRLQPLASESRWIIRETPTSQIAYGAANPTFPRPRILWNSTRQRYRIPSSVFRSEEVFRTSFYDFAQAPFDPATEVAPPVPTHFIFRDIVTGRTAVANAIRMEDYDSDIRVTGTSQLDRYNNTTLLVEFIHRPNSGNDQILIAVPVDVLPEI